MIVGTDSWVTVAEADLYAQNKFGETAWSPLLLAQKEQLLVTAFYRIHDGYGIPASSTSDLVKRAQCEMALFLLHFTEDMSRRNALQAMGVKEFTIDKFSETFRDSGGTFFPVEVTSILGDPGVSVVTEIERAL